MSYLIGKIMPAVIEARGDLGSSVDINVRNTAKNLRGTGPILHASEVRISGATYTLGTGSVRWGPAADSRAI